MKSDTDFADNTTFRKTKKSSDKMPEDEFTRGTTSVYKKAKRFPTSYAV